MWWVIIAIIFILITGCLLKDTHVKVYKMRYHAELQEEYDLELPIWTWILMIFAYFLPIINILTFIIFLGNYIIHSTWDPDECDGETHVFSLNGNNWITKSLLVMKRILNKKI